MLVCCLHVSNVCAQNKTDSFVIKHMLNLSIDFKTVIF